jgi:hypothetical protein
MIKCSLRRHPESVGVMTALTTATSLYLQWEMRLIKIALMRISVAGIALRRIPWIKLGNFA